MNLDKLPATGFKLSCYPVKIKKASAGWIRAGAMIEEKRKNKPKHLYGRNFPMQMFFIFLSDTLTYE
ncbi:hypothetical protein ACLZX5_03410 [Enterococcus faecium]